MYLLQATYIGTDGKVLKCLTVECPTWNDLQRELSLRGSPCKATRIVLDIALPAVSTTQG